MQCALLLLLGLLGAASASPTPGPWECARGSAVWCQDLEAAARCGAVGYCQSAVWSKPTAKSLPCSLCQDTVAAAGNGMNPNATDADVLALLMQNCEWLPSQESSARCKRMADTQHSAILGMLHRAPGRAPAQVCTALTLCEPLQRHPVAPPGPLSQEDASEETTAPSRTDGALSFQPPQTPGGAICQDCVRLVSRLQDAVQSNLTLAELSLQEPCASLPPGLALLCKNYLLQVPIPTEQMLRPLPPQEVCQRRGFCGELGTAARLAQVAAADGVPSLEMGLVEKRSEVLQMPGMSCEVCLAMMQKMEQWLKSNSTVAMIRRGLEHMCSLWHNSFVEKCVLMVDTYSPSLVQILASVTPEKMCNVIRLCGHRRRARAAHGAHATTPLPLLDAENQGSFCNSCKKLLSVSSHNLESTSTRRDILMAFKGGCSILPLTYMIQCNHFVTQYQPVLIESLKDMMDPVAVCKKLGACHGPRNPLLGTDQCVMGPSFWCRSPEAAELCNAVQHCQAHAWKEEPTQAGGHA
ncbi:proactivator polypeptide-like 1 [Carlito syrichta]|uniref:Proactivator polypeptide-like 1 n=1 Tax=Carlito syrichta TaxID=1868482 RepID=A0A1U7TDN4_CARSF|nr:proactivator polypeptide-like 1 [Carlito syrichta]